MPKKKNKKSSFDKPGNYINRELSWIAFNKRVLELASRLDMPLMERLKFMAIFSSNLDEFFMIRVAGLNQQLDAKIRKRSIDGRTPLQQLNAISQQLHPLVKTHTQLLNDILKRFCKEGLHVLRRADWTPHQQAHLKDLFHREIMPVLTGLAVQQQDPCPLLPGLQLNVALTLSCKKDSSKEQRLMVIPIPNLFARFFPLSSQQGQMVVPIEDIIADNSAEFAEGYTITSVDFFRLTRDADVTVKEDEAGDLLDVMEDAVLQRRRRSAVRLEISAGASPSLMKWLYEQYSLRDIQVYEIDGLLDAKSLWQIVNLPGFDYLKYTDWPPQPPLDMTGFDSIWDAIKEHDILMYHPYESFEPVVQILQEAALNPSVLAIKQTLYRTSGDSPIIDALEQAAENGKEVTVLVELKARFDETRNVQWARRLEDAGCHVIYGIAGLKTHAKALLIIRREKGMIHRYVHLATGNYNDTTAKLYSDIGMFSCDSRLATDVAAFFNLLTGFSEAVGWSRLSIAPVNMKKRFIEMIDREIKVSSPDKPGLIMAKVNSLEDKEIIQALYRASSKGVKILLNIRGICCLKPGIKGISENIEVVSILGRYLEHARMFYFSNGGHSEVYLSSADWMTRNLDKRFELLFPVHDPDHKKRCKSILETCFTDNTGAWKLLKDGTYQPVEAGKKKVSAQNAFYEYILLEQKKKLKDVQRFRPVQPKK